MKAYSNPFHLVNEQLEKELLGTDTCHSKECDEVKDRMCNI